MKNKLREFWVDAKEFIPEFLKWFVLTIVMFWGFVLIYGAAWLCLGLPDPNWVAWIWCGLAIGSELLYFWWIANS
jgi:hypothetical protein